MAIVVSITSPAETGDYIYIAGGLAYIEVRVYGCIINMKSRPRWGLR